MSSIPLDVSRVLTIQRLRAQALVLAICLWGIYLWILATPGLRDRDHLIKGTDFLHFYTLGSIALSHDGSSLYDMNAQALLLGAQVPEAAGTKYLPLYGPQVSLIFAPLASTSYMRALGLWWLISAAIYLTCVWAIWRRCPNLAAFPGTVALVAVAYPAFWHLIAWGQTSALALASFTAAYLLLLGGKKFAAGLALGCLAFKPQLGIATALVFVAAGEWAIVGGALLTAIAQLFIGWGYYGTVAMVNYWNHISGVAGVWSLLEPRLYQTHSLRTFWLTLIPTPGVAWGLYGVCAMIVLWLALRSWRSSLPLSLRYSALLLATVLISPHLTVYDLVILGPAFLLTVDWALSNRGVSDTISSLAYGAYLLPLLGPMAKWTHLQLSVLAFSGWLWAIWKTGRTPATTAADQSPAQVSLV